MRTLPDIEQEITDAYTTMLEYRAIGDRRMARHYERWMRTSSWTSGCWSLHGACRSSESSTTCNPFALAPRLVEPPP